MPSRAPRQPRGLTTLRDLIIAVAAFLAVTNGIRHLAGVPDVGLLEDKLAYWQVHKDNIDTLFFGSSRIYRGIDPTVFDPAMADHGHPTRSFNFGIAGMSAHEANALIRRVLATKPARLHRVVVEIDDWDPVIDRRNRLKRRGILWHDLPETASALRSTLLLDRGFGARADLLATHVVHFIARATAAGRGRELWARRKPPPPFEHGGFRTFSERSYTTHPMRRSFLADQDRFIRAVALLPAANAARPQVERYNVGAIAAQAAMIRRAGAEPVHVIPPSPRATPTLHHLHAEGVVPVLIAFNDPRTDPDLFALERRFDREHLTAEGAELFSRRLAERLAERLAARRTERMATSDERPDRPMAR